MSVTIKGMKSHEHGMCHQEYFSVENKHRLLADSALREWRVKAKQPCDAFCSLKLCCPVRAAPVRPMSAGRGGGVRRMWGTGNQMRKSGFSFSRWVPVRG